MATAAERAEVRARLDGLTNAQLVYALGEILEPSAGSPIEYSDALADALFTVQRAYERAYPDICSALTNERDPDAAAGNEADRLYDELRDAA